MSGIDEFRETDTRMLTFRQAGVVALMAGTLSAAGVAVAAGFDQVVVTATVDGTTGTWGPGPSATTEPEPTPAIEETTPAAAPSAEPVIPATTVTPTSSTPTSNTPTSSPPAEATSSPSEPAPTTEP